MYGKVMMKPILIRTTERGKEIIYRKEVDEGDGGQKYD